MKKGELIALFFCFTALGWFLGRITEAIVLGNLKM